MLIDVSVCCLFVWFYDAVEPMGKPEDSWKPIQEAVKEYLKIESIYVCLFIIQLKGYQM